MSRFDQLLETVDPDSAERLRGTRSNLIIFDDFQNKRSDYQQLNQTTMRRAIQKGAYVKVVKGPELYNENLEKAKELGSTEIFGKKVPNIGDAGDVIGVDDGYILVRFGDSNESLIDSSSLEIEKRKEETKFLARYANNSIEEFSNEEECQARMKELFSQGHMKVGETVKVYNVEGYKEVKIKVEVAFT